MRRDTFIFPRGDLLKLGGSETTSCQDSVTGVDRLEDKLCGPHQVSEAYRQRQPCRSQGIRACVCVCMSACVHVCMSVCVPPGMWRLEDSLDISSSGTIYLFRDRLSY